MDNYTESKVQNRNLSSFLCPLVTFETESIIWKCANFTRFAIVCLGATVKPESYNQHKLLKLRLRWRIVSAWHKKEEMVKIKVKEILRRLSIIFRCLMGLFLLRLWFHLVPVSKRVTNLQVSTIAKWLNDTDEKTYNQCLIWKETLISKKNEDSIPSGAFSWCRVLLPMLIWKKEDIRNNQQLERKEKTDHTRICK